MTSKILILGASLATLAFSASQAGAITVLPPSYGAYVVGYGGLTSDPGTQEMQNGVLPNFSYSGDAGVELASGIASGSYGSMSAFANLKSGDISITTSSNSGYETEVIALFYTKVTFSGSGNGTLNYGGTLSESGAAHAEEWVGLSTSAPSMLPEAGFSIPSTATAWSASQNFTYTDGETAYVLAQLSAGSQGGSVSVSDPFSLSLETGDSFIADAPQFLLPVPEPATWAMLLLGFGAIGWTLRGARRSGAVTA